MFLEKSFPPSRHSVESGRKYWSFQRQKKAKGSSVTYFFRKSGSTFVTVKRGKPTSSKPAPGVIIIAHNDEMFELF